MAEIPFMREQVLLRVNDSKQDDIMREFDIVLSDVESHKAQILSKLSVMLIDVIHKSMITGHPARYKNKFDESANPGPSDFVDKITKNMSNLNKTIVSVLDEECRKIIFNGVFPTFIDEIEIFIENMDEEGFNWFKNDLKHLEKETMSLAKNISTGVAFINKIRELQKAKLDDLVYEEEEESEEEN